jgi:hypothetical protein
VPRGSTGVAIDSTVSLPGTTGRPAASPYNYSDMTGSIALLKTLPRGTWEVIQDGGQVGTVWGKVTWNTEAAGSLPPGTLILVEVRAADTVAGLGGRPFVQVQNDVGFSVTGRYLDVRVVLRPDANGVAQALGTIIDDDEPAVLSVTDVTVEEGDEGTVEALFEISLSKVPGQTVTVDYTTVDGTATADLDYRPAVGYLTFPAGTTALTVKVEVVGDTATEPDETYTLQLSNLAGAVFGKAQGLGTIIDDDNVEVSIGDVEVTEGDSGTTAAVFTLSAPRCRGSR